MSAPVRMGGFVGDVRAGPSLRVLSHRTEHTLLRTAANHTRRAKAHGAYVLLAPRAGARWALGWQWRALVPSVRGGVGCRSTRLSSVLSCRVS